MGYLPGVWYSYRALSSFDWFKSWNGNRRQMYIYRPNWNLIAHFFYLKCVLKFVMNRSTDLLAFNPLSIIRGALNFRPKNIFHQ
jgi:hypothetical protein